MDATLFIHKATTLFDYMRNETTRFIEEDFKNDWQLQGCFVLLILFIFLSILLKLQWNCYGPVITGMELIKSSGGSKDNVDHAHHDTFPDEDPLTFTKKSN